MLTLDAETDHGCALATVLSLHGFNPSTAQRCSVDGITSSRLVYTDKKAEQFAKEAEGSDEYRQALRALQDPNAPDSTIRASTLYLRAESLRQVPVIYQDLPNGKTLAISGDLSPAQIRQALARALTT